MLEDNTHIDLKLSIKYLMKIFKYFIGVLTICYFFGIIWYIISEISASGYLENRWKTFIITAPNPKSTNKDKSLGSDDEEYFIYKFGLIDDTSP